MMGTQRNQKELFNYQVDLDRRVRRDHPLRKIAEVVDFTFVRGEVADRYGYNGNVSVDPAVVLKMMFLLFYEDVGSERELMRVVPERLDWMWFLGYGLDDEIPDHSVLSKARRRWGREAFERFFVRTVGQCVAAGLVEGRKIHVDASLTDADASRDSVVKASKEMVAKLRAAYEATERKLDEAPVYYERVNDGLISTTDPEAAVVRKGNQPPRPRYHAHRVLDNIHGVITATETTAGDVAENRKLIDLVAQHEKNTGQKVEVAVADNKYGTVENFVACQQQGITTHMGDVRVKQNNPRCQGIFTETAFVFDAASNTYRCPAGQTMKPRRLHPIRRTWEYWLPKEVCGSCELRRQCTRSVLSRTIHRHEQQDLLDRAREQAHSPAARQDRKRRLHLAEGSFAEAVTQHHFKRARWRRLWRVQIQDYLIAAIQNVKILLKQSEGRAKAAMQQTQGGFRETFVLICAHTIRCFRAQPFVGVGWRRVLAPSRV